MATGNIIIKNASQLVTCSGKTAKQGSEMSNLHVIENGAVVIEKGLITQVGTTEELLDNTTDGNHFDKTYMIIDAKNHAVLPGFVDAHTHFVFGGYRAEEFSRRLSGDSYMDIMKRGGGILSTVESTRKAKKEELFESGRRRLDSMLSFGVTTVEGKSGYGLDLETEIKQLEVMAELDNIHPVDIIRTFLGAHTIPIAYQSQSDQFIDFMIEKVMPEICKRSLAEFCDIFCEKNVFSIEQSKKLLRRAKEMGFKLKIHADEMVPLGGAELAASLGAVSADHLLCVSEKGIQEMAKAGTLAVLLPGTAFCLREKYASARKMIDSDIAIALATDFNPGSCFSNSIPLIAALAALNMGMTPEEIITALTINGAAAIDRADCIGSIDKGKKGDLVILEFPTYHYLLYHTGVSIVKKVIKNGRIVYEKGGC